MHTAAPLARKQDEGPVPPGVGREEDCRVNNDAGLLSSDRQRSAEKEEENTNTANDNSDDNNNTNKTKGDENSE